jgi:hypothetical protein
VTKPIAVRFYEFTLERLRALAVHRDTGLPGTAEVLVVERPYEEETGEGIIL